MKSYVEDRQESQAESDKFPHIVIDKGVEQKLEAVFDQIEGDFDPVCLRRPIHCRHLLFSPHLPPSIHKMLEQYRYW